MSIPVQLLYSRFFCFCFVENCFASVTGKLFKSPTVFQVYVDLDTDTVTFRMADPDQNTILCKYLVQFS